MGTKAHSFSEWLKFVFQIIELLASQDWWHEAPYSGGNNMADVIAKIDDRRGNAFEVYEVQHVTGTATTFEVDQSASSATHSPVASQSSINASLSIDSSGGSTEGDSDYGMKTVTIASGAASGTYFIVVLHQGNAAGIASTKSFGA